MSNPYNPFDIKVGDRIVTKEYLEFFTKQTGISNPWTVLDDRFIPVLSVQKIRRMKPREQAVFFEDYAVRDDVLVCECTSTSRDVGTSKNLIQIFPITHVVSQRVLDHEFPERPRCMGPAFKSFEVEY